MDDPSDRVGVIQVKAFVSYPAIVSALKSGGKVVMVDVSGDGV